MEIQPQQKQHQQKENKQQPKTPRNEEVSPFKLVVEEPVFRKVKAARKLIFKTPEKEDRNRNKSQMKAALVDVKQELKGSDIYDTSDDDESDNSPVSIENETTSEEDENSQQEAEEVNNNQTFSFF